MYPVNPVLYMFINKSSRITPIRDYCIAFFLLKIPLCINPNVIGNKLYRNRYKGSIVCLQSGH